MFRGNPRHGPRSRRRLAVLLDDDVRVGPAGTKRRDAGNSRELSVHPIDPDQRTRPGLQRSLDPERRAREIDVGVQLLDVQARNERGVLQLQNDLGKACDAGGRFQMPNVRLHGSDCAELPVLRAGGECLRQPCNLYRISQLRSRTVCLEIAHCAWIDVRTR